MDPAGETGNWPVAPIPMHVRDVMRTSPVQLGPDASAVDAARLLASSGLSDVMVVGAGDIFLGVVSEGDLIRALLPDWDEVMQAGGSVEAASEALLHKAERLTVRPIGPYVITDPVTLSPRDHIAVAAAALDERGIRRLPVVEDDRLVGTLSRGDLLRAVVERYAPS